MSKQIPTPTKIIFLIRTSPYTTSRIKEAMDVILTALTLDMHTSIIFLDDGIWQLKSKQNSATIQEKNYTATFKALHEFGEVNIYVENESLIERELTTSNLFMPVKQLDRKSVTQLLSEQDILLTF